MIEEGQHNGLDDLLLQRKSLIPQKTKLLTSVIEEGQHNTLDDLHLKKKNLIPEKKFSTAPLKEEDFRNFSTFGDLAKEVNLNPI